MAVKKPLCETFECAREARALGLCGPCYQRDYRARNAEEVKLGRKRWQQKHRAKIQAYQSAYYFTVTKPKRQAKAKGRKHDA